MNGLILLTLGICLIVAEAFVPSVGLLGLAGLISFFVGAHYIVEAGGIFGIPLGWDFFFGMAVIVAIPTLISAYLFGKHRKAKLISGIEGMIGQEAKIVEWQEKSGRVHAQGELWAAHSLHEHQFAEDDIVIISGIDDMSLTIHKKS
jgi:membrane-bound serine protease (ClpP class)